MSFPALSNVLEHWRMNEASGSRSGVKGRLLSESGTVSGVSGILGLAAQTNSSNYLDRVYEAAIDLATLSDCTVGFWAYLTTTGTQYVGAGQYLTGGSNRCWLIYYDGSRWRFTTSDNGSVSHLNQVEISWSTTGAWHCIMVWNGTTPSSQKGISINDGTPATTGYHAIKIDTGNHFRVGHGGQTGRIDSLTIWDKVLSSAERTAFYNSGSGVAFPAGGSISWMLSRAWDRVAGGLLVPRAFDRILVPEGVRI